MILVDLFKVNTATCRSLARGKPVSAITVRAFIANSAPPSSREVDIQSEGIRIAAVRVAEEARTHARAGRGSGHGRKQSSSQTPFNLESQQHEQKSRGFAGL
jgi:hypothetical protein